MGRLLRTFLGQVFNGSDSAPSLSSDVLGRSQVVDALPSAWWWLELSALHPEVLRVATLSVERFADIDTSRPIHSELGVWYDQGWRILLKAMLAYYHSLAERQMLGPTLRIEKVSDGIEVSWAAWHAGYTLVTTPQLRRIWATANSGHVIRNGRYVATSKDLAGPLFFRLFKD
jgi:hypothetical protein